MRTCRFMAAVAVTALAAGSASAQQAVRTQPVSPSAIVQPTTNTVAGTVGNVIRGMGSVVSGTLENNGFVKTLNNLLGRTVVTPTQPGFSPLPDPRSFASTRYPNSFRPATPVMSRFGQTPTAIIPNK